MKVVLSKSPDFVRSTNLRLKELSSFNLPTFINKLRRIVDYLTNKKILRFDDGVEHDKKFIALMKKYRLSGTFNISAGLFGTKHSLAHINHIPKDEIRQVYEGFEVASHGYRHEMYRYMSGKKIIRSLEADIRKLSEVIGYPVSGHAYPYDMRTRTAEDYLRKNNLLYTRKALGKKAKFYFPADPLSYIATAAFNAKNIMELLDDFIKATPENDNLLFMMWGHSWEMEYGFRKCPEAEVERIFDKIAGHPDIVYCTSKEAFSINYLISNTDRNTNSLAPPRKISTVISPASMSK